MNPPTIATIGAGAIGGAMAAALGDAGHRLRLCVRTPFERLTRRLGDRVTSYDHRVVTDPAEVEPVDWVVLCTKAHQIPGAARWLDALLGPHSRIAVMQNGVDHAARVAHHVPPERVVPCVILLPSQVAATGEILQARQGTVQVPDTDAGRGLAAIFAGQEAVRIVPTRDFVTALWEKLILNAVGGAICSLALKPLGAVAAPEVRALAVALVEEVAAVARAEGASIPRDCAQRAIDTLGGPIATHWTSMAVDRREGRLMEWEARNAVVGRIARRHGIATPLNDALTQLLALVDARATADHRD